jgi:hypothetical protein
MPDTPSFFDLYYVLREAYDRLGHRLYGDQWTGEEINETRLEPPGVIEAIRAPIEARLVAIVEELKSEEEQLGKSPDAQVVARSKAKIEALFRERETLTRQLQHIYEPNDSYRERYAAHQRRANTEAILVDALGKEKVQAIYGSNTILPGFAWRGERGFRYSLECSIAIVPRHVNAIRRGPVFVKASSFADWLRTVAPEAPAGAAQRAIRECCTQFLLEKTKETNGQQIKSRDEYFEEARTEIPGLSREEFLRVWGNTVPESWRGRGRRKWNRN